MPYASDAQRKKFHAMAQEGKLSQSTVDEFDKASEGLTLPNRVAPKAGRQAIKKFKIKNPVGF